MYESEIKAIDDMYTTFDYFRCLQECFSLLKRIDKKDVNNYTILFNCYYKISAIYSLLFLKNKSIFYGKQAFLYVQNKTERAKLNWTLSCIYMDISKRKAIRYITDAIKEYGEIEDISLFLQSSIHKHFLLNDANTILSLMDDLKEFNLDINRMDQIYEDLIKVYINTNQIIKAQSTLLKIKNKKIKEKMRTKIYKICAEIG